MSGEGEAARREAVEAICRRATAHNHGQTVGDVETLANGGIRVAMSSWPRVQEALRALRAAGYDAVEGCLPMNDGLVVAAAPGPAVPAELARQEHEGHLLKVWCVTCERTVPLLTAALAAPAPLAETREAAARAWRTEDINGEHAVVVAMGREDDPYWYVLCPAAATLYIDVAAVRTYADDCSIGAECEWTEQHLAAAALIERLAALSAPPAPTEPRDLDDPEWEERVAAARAQGDMRPASMFRRPGFAFDDEDAAPAAPTEGETP
jgi:hypothetical protein